MIDKALACGVTHLLTGDLRDFDPFMNIEEGIRALARGGLNLVAILDCAALPAQIAGIMTRSEVPLADYRRLVLIGHGGRRMWGAVQVWGMTTADPVDHYSVSLTRQFVCDCLGDARILWLYPGTAYTIPLQQLGEAAGWSTPSPLGSGINPVYGVWFAYRAALLIDADLPLVRECPAPSPCNDCEKRQCIDACPAGAVRMDAVDIEGCAHHRLRPQSPCADRCLARLACPYLAEHRYTWPQIRYHYRRSLATLRAWYDG